jgi:hypothetical protein
MDHFVTLESLPGEIRWPKDLADRVGYDAERKRLWYKGWMCKAEYDRLFLLSQDWTYRRKLEELFQVSIPDDGPKGVGARRAMLAAVGIVAVGAALAVGWRAWLSRSGTPAHATAANAKPPAAEAGVLGR